MGEPSQELTTNTTNTTNTINTINTINSTKMATEKLNYNDTVYIRNINEKVTINTLKNKLTELFQSYGPILSITAHKNLRMRGQAFVTLEDERKALDAIKDLDGLKVFDKNIQVELAKSSSDLSVEKHVNDDEFKQYLQKRKLYKQELEEKKLRAPKKVKLDNTPPNKILLIQDLPSDATRDELVDIFGKYKGFVEVRLVAVRKVAFVEYETDEDAIPAKNENQDLDIRDSKPSVNFAKK